MAAPSSTTLPSASTTVSVKGMASSEKSTPPSAIPMGGMRMSLVRDVTMAPKAPAMITAVANSSTLPFMMNALNSFSIS